MLGGSGPSQGILDIESDILDYCLKKEGKWWATSFFYNKEVKELFSKIRSKNISEALDTIEEVVTTNDKKRFTFNDDKTKIRASQGHFIKVDLELKPVEPPETLYHGTIKERFDSIVKNGLVKGKRQYIHLSKDKETACKVGRRHKGELLILMVDAIRMHEDGYPFYLSKNGVWLTDKVPTDYLTESKKLNRDWMK